MSLIQASYTYYEPNPNAAQKGEEPFITTHHDKELTSYRQLTEFLDNYHLSEQLKRAEEYNQGSGLDFYKEEQHRYAIYSLIPFTETNGMLLIEIVEKEGWGWLSLFGRKSVSKEYDDISISEARLKIKELFEHSIESLYLKYKNERE